MSNCRSCGSRGILSFKTIVDPSLNRKVEFFLCQGCGSMQHDDPGFKEEGLRFSDLYGDLGDGYQMFCMTLAQRMFRDMPIIRYLPPGDLLDIECNDGVLAMQWVSRGWKVTGTSLSEKSRARARERGIECTDDPSYISKMDFDGVLLETSYSHFDNPFRLFDEGIRRISNGGFLLIHGYDALDLASNDESWEGIGYTNRTIPSSKRIIEWMSGRGMRLVERYHIGNSMDLMFIKAG